MRIGILGGSFDPVHYGHLLIGETCREACQLDEVWFIPAAISPHKRQQPPADATHRVAMLKLAVAGHPNFAVSTLEIDRGGVSYTGDTLVQIAQDRPEAELFLLLGADSLLDLPKWRNPERICQLAIPVVVNRPDSAPPDYQVLAHLVSADRLQQFARYQVEMPLIQISSTDIRQRAATGQSIRYRTPRAVEKYIETHRLYASESP